MGRIPKLCRHKASGKAYATDPFTRREHYFRAPYGSPECSMEYSEWVRRLLDRRQIVSSGTPPGSSVTVARLLTDFMIHARVYYRKDGKETREIDALSAALEHVNDMYGTLPADAFGPSELKAVRQRMVEFGWARTNINHQVQRIRRVWKWGVEQEIIEPRTLDALKAVPGLRLGRSGAYETVPIGPVPLDAVEATLSRLSAPVRAMVEVQLHADMRPGEVCIMRPVDIDRRGEPWLYIPYKHKTEHRGRQRRIYLGPKARAVLAPLLLKCPCEDGWLFPSRARGRHAAGRTHWTPGGYWRAIQKACEQEPPIPAWHPNQLRHTQATAIRQQFGAEAAQIVLGHSQLETSEIYAERNERLAKDIAEKIG